MFNLKLLWSYPAFIPLVCLNFFICLKALNLVWLKLPRIVLIWILFWELFMFFILIILLIRASKTRFIRFYTYIYGRWYIFSVPNTRNSWRIMRIPGKTSDAFAWNRKTALSNIIWVAIIRWVYLAGVRH